MTRGWLWIVGGILVLLLLLILASAIWQLGALSNGCPSLDRFCDPYLPNVPGKEGR